MTESKLTKKAKELKLTARQKLFAEALAADPARNQRKAAESAGYSKGAEVRASQLVRDPKIKEYLQTIVGEAVQAGEDNSVAKSHEVLQRLTQVARSDIGRHLTITPDGDARLSLDAAHTGIIREYVEERERTQKDGTTTTTISTKRIRVADPLPALQSLAKIYNLEPPADTGPRINVLALLGALPPELLDRLAGMAQS